ncbi:MAG: hypothetical protein ACRDM1_07760 [Gaiellaceae bacterium]
MIRCRLLGHRYRFVTDGSRMSWTCGRCGHEGGVKEYGSPQEAERYASVFDREDREDLGRHAPLIAGLPLRLIRVWRKRRLG